MKLTSLADVARAGARFVNRPRGAGTRVWLDAQLRRARIDSSAVPGYQREVTTHAEVARAIAEDQADAGLGIEAAAIAYGLDFVRLTTEPYDLIIPADSWSLPPVQALATWLASTEGRAAIEALGGYEISEAGHITWID